MKTTQVIRKAGSVSGKIPAKTTIGKTIVVTKQTLKPQGSKFSETYEKAVSQSKLAENKTIVTKEIPPWENIPETIPVNQSVNKEKPKALKEMEVEQQTQRPERSLMSGLMGSHFREVGTTIKR